MELDEQLQEAGERWREAQRAAVVDFARATAWPRGLRFTRRTRSLLVVSVAAALIVAVITVMVLTDGDSSPQKVIVTQPTAPTTPVSGLDPPSVLPLDPEIVQTGALAMDGESLWVTGDAPQGRAATLEHISTNTGEVLAKVVLPDNGPFQIVVGDNAVWVSSQQNEESAHVTRVDPTTGKITAVIPTAGDAAVAVWPDAVWVDVNTGTLLRLDPATNKVVATIPLPGGPYSAHFINAGLLGVFLANGYDGTVLRVDPATNTVKQIADVGSSAGPIVELNGALWVSSGSSVLFEMNPNTGVVKRRIDLGPHFQGMFPTSDGHSLLMRTDGPRLVRVDPDSGETTSQPFPDDVQYVSQLGADLLTHTIWVAVEHPTPRLLRAHL
jgi:streptogramin lyase